MGVFKQGPLQLPHQDPVSPQGASGHGQGPSPSASSPTSVAAPDLSALALAILEASPDGILVVDPEGRVMLVNQSLAQLCGWSTDELITMSLFDLLPSYLADRHTAWLRNYFREPMQRPMGKGQDLWLLHKDGHEVPVDVSLGYVHDMAVAFVREISHLRKLQAQTLYQASHDTLTGLYNRWHFMQHLGTAVTAAASGARGFSLVLLDLDDFKGINDSYGHETGDALLREVSNRLKAAIGEADVVARLGGDEFTVLVAGTTDAEEVQQRVQQWLASIRRPVYVQGVRIECGSSAGVAAFGPDTPDGETLMRFADMAMYHAKENGRNRCSVYHPSMGAKLTERMKLQERLQHALQHGGLMLHYQPQVDVRTGEILAAEALLRWHDSQLGWVDPARLVAVAEACGLIHALGRWVMEAVCAQIGAWQRSGTPIRVAVNVSAQQLMSVEWIQHLQQVLQRHQVQPGLLEVELTESEAMADAAQAHQILTQVAALGVQVSLDDFGTGYSSLAYLQRLPISRLKIARDFVAPMLHSHNDTALVRAVVDLAHNLGMHVVAEGVESAQQLRLLQSLGCDSVQGWLYYRAMSGDQLQVMLAQRRGAIHVLPHHPADPQQW